MVFMDIFHYLFDSMDDSSFRIGPEAETACIFQGFSVSPEAHLITIRNIIPPCFELSFGGDGTVEILQ